MKKILSYVLAAAVAVVAGLGLAQERDPLVILQGAEPPTLDWQFHESGYGANVYNTIFDRLVAFDREMAVVPQLAESWEVSEDGTTWRFHLREGVTFHNGEPFNAESVRYTLLRPLQPEMIEAEIFDPFPERVGLVDVHVIDEYTVDIDLEAPSSMFLSWLTFQKMLPPKYYSNTPLSELATNPVGTGPWKFVEWERDDHIRLEAFEDYWKGEPEIEQVEWRPVPDPFTRLAVLEAGEADIISQLSPEDIELVERNPDLRVGMSKGGFRVHVGIPVADVPAYQDPRVRQALNYAIDWETIDEAILAGMSSGRLVSPVIGESWMHPELGPYPYDLERARELLEEADFPMDREITLHAPSGRYTKDRELAEAVAQNLRDIGLDVTVQAYEWGVYYPMFQRGELDDLFLFGLGSRHYGPEDITIISAENFFDKTKWTTVSEEGERFENLVDELARTVDRDEQQEVINELQEIAHEQAPWIYLWTQAEAFGISNRIDWEPSGNYYIRLWVQGEPGPSWTD